MVHSPLKSCVLFILLLLKKIIKSFLLYSSHSREPDDRVQPCFASLLIHSRERNTFSTLSLSKMADDPMPTRWSFQVSLSLPFLFYRQKQFPSLDFFFRFDDFLHRISPILVERIVTVYRKIDRSGRRIFFFNFNVFVLPLELL